MFALQAHDVAVMVSMILAGLGVILVLAGFILLLTRATGKAVNTIAAQTTRMAQKGLAEDIAGLVGNASSLIEALNQLVLTTAGVGIFLILSGFIMLVASYLMIKFL